MKLLSKAVTAALKLIHKKIKNYKQLYTINKLNPRNKAISIFRFDLSASDINSPHHKLKSVIRELICCCFNSGDTEFIGVTGYGAFWTNSQEKISIVF